MQEKSHKASPLDYGHCLKFDPNFVTQEIRNNTVSHGKLRHNLRVDAKEPQITSTEPSNILFF